MLCEGEGHGWVAYMCSRMTAGSLCVWIPTLLAPAPTSIVTSWAMCVLAGGKRTGADYSAEATACREMYEETAGKLQRDLLALQSCCMWSLSPLHAAACSCDSPSGPSFSRVPLACSCIVSGALCTDRLLCFCCLDLPQVSVQIVQPSRMVHEAIAPCVQGFLAAGMCAGTGCQRCSGTPAADMPCSPSTFLGSPTSHVSILLYPHFSTQHGWEHVLSKRGLLRQDCHSLGSALGGEKRTSGSGVARTTKPEAKSQ